MDLTTETKVKTEELINNLKNATTNREKFETIVDTFRVAGTQSAKASPEFAEQYFDLVNKGLTGLMITILSSLKTLKS